MIKNPWENETLVGYSCKETPYIRINIIENDKEIYSIVLDSISSYLNYFGYDYEQDYITFNTTLINPQDYSVLVSKHYNKYILDIQQIWRNANTGEDELIELPSKVFSNMELDYFNNCSSDCPTTWRFIFNNEVK